MPLKLVPILEGFGLGGADVLFEYLDEEVVKTEEPYTIKNVARPVLYGLGLVGSVFAKEGTLLSDVSETMMIAQEPLLVRTIYNVIKGATQGQTKRDLELKLKHRSRGGSRTIYV